MRKLLLSLLVVALAVPAFANSDKFKTHPKKIPGQYIVVFEKGVDVDAVSEELTHKFKGEKKHKYHKAIRGFSIKLNEKKAMELAEDPRVAWVEEDGEFTATATQSGATWGLDRVDQRDLPLNSSYTYNTTASNVTAYIIDTGILSSHSQFGGRVRSGYTAINDGRGTTDCNGHGTHVAGTVGGSTYGVAKAVNLVAVRVLDCNGSGTNSGVIAGVDWVAQDHAAGTPAVANMSLGGGASSALDTAVNNAINDGITFVVASGNENVDACSSSPARVANAITVNSSTSTDGRSSFSNYGTCTDIFAPGSSITSAWHTSTSATNTISGTSMASPHVAGVAALYLAQNPSASPSSVWVAIRDSATSNKISNPGSGSPNRLVYSLLTAGGGGGGGTPTVTELSNGQAVSSLSGATGSFVEYKIAVPSGQDSLEIAISGGSGDADLYVKFGQRATTSNWDYRPYKNGNNEVVSVSSPAAGDWYIALHGYSSYSGVTLVATYATSGGGGGGGGGCTSYTGYLSGTGASEYEPNGSYYYSGTSGAHTGSLSGPSNADFDLYLQKWNGWGWSTVDRSESASSTETINYNGSSGYYRWRVYSYSGSGSFSLCTTNP